MTSADRVRAAGASLLVLWLLAGADGASAEGTFYKNKRKPPATVDGAASAPAVVAAPAPPPAAPAPPPPPPPPAPAPPPPPAPAPPAPPPPAPPPPAPPPPAPPPPPPAPPAPDNRAAEGPAIAGAVESLLATDTLVVGGRRIRLAGLEGITGPALPSMQQWLRNNGNQVSCTPVGTRHRCITATGKDVAQVVLLNGLGKVTADAPPAYVQAEKQARDGVKGVWAPR